ncbi:hypothetical protein D068_cds30390 [Bacillus atrophaeus UCMB-5137]|nr:hypothetical protein D068_cds30390 [Bacillus atrophaeus UCMB-5137]
MIGKLDALDSFFSSDNDLVIYLALILIPLKCSNWFLIFSLYEDKPE